jgi:pyruvate,orthophosphate dikinase
MVEQESGVKLTYQIGTMIELPAAALRAGEISNYADYLSFGTNDLTQTTLGISRDDAASFLGSYQSKGIIEHDPFVRLDQETVGELIKIAVERARKAKPGIKIGICGEHGGDPAAIQFFHDLGFDYVSCSPYRVPIARLAAAQAVLKRK